LQMDIYLPLFPQPIDISGKIVRIKRSSGDRLTVDTGLEYLGMTPSDRIKLSETMRSLYKTRSTEE